MSIPALGDPRDASLGDRGMPSAAIVVIPCLNEERYIENTLSCFMAEPREAVRKIVVADGGSTDRTLAIVAACAGRDDRIAIVDNEQRIQSSGVNRAVERYGDLAPYLIRVDAHAGYPAGYCATLLRAQAASGAQSVVVSMIAEGASCFQTATAAAQNSRLGNGGSAHRMAAEGRFVDHGHHALMEVKAFRAVGGYDEAFSHNEDAELDARLSAAGARIYLCAGADITYYPRKDPVSLFRQYRNFGRGRAMNILKHRSRPRLRQLIPVMVGPAVCLALLSPLSSVFAVPALCWAAASLALGIVEGVRQRKLCAAASGCAAMLMHLGFSTGFVVEMLRQAVGAGRPAKRGGFPAPLPAVDQS
jgi:succinoglycan biosynthesis protein ExoA